MRNTAAILRATGLLLVGTVAAAQSQSVCIPGQRALADFGYDAIECVNCEINSNAPVWIIFHAPARLRDIRSAGPAFGRLAEGDSLVAIDGIDLTVREGSERYSLAMPGDRVQFTVRRGGSAVTVAIIAGLKCVPGAGALSRVKATAMYSGLARSARGVDAGNSASHGWLGIGITTSVRPDRIALPSTASRPFPQPPRVAVVAPGGPAANAGIEAGDRLLAVDGASLLTTKGADRFRNPVVGVSMTILLVRDGEEHTVIITPAIAPAEPPSFSRRP